MPRISKTKAKLAGGKANDVSPANEGPDESEEDQRSPNQKAKEDRAVLHHLLLQAHESARRGVPGTGLSLIPNLGVNTGRGDTAHWFVESHRVPARPYNKVADALKELGRQVAIQIILPSLNGKPPLDGDFQLDLPPSLWANLPQFVQKATFDWRLLSRPHQVNDLWPFLNSSRRFNCGYWLRHASAPFSTLPLAGLCYIRLPEPCSRSKHEHRSYNALLLTLHIYIYIIYVIL